MSTHDTLHEKITDLECKFVFQQETLDTLNDQVTKQWAEIDRLTKQLGRLHDQMTALENDIAAPGAEPPPPHY